MSKPATPERDALLAQFARIEAVAAGADWHTDLGAGVALSAPAEEKPALQCWPSDVTTEAAEDGVSALTSITWTASVPLVGDDMADAELVRADLRAALVSTCPLGTTREMQSGVTQREPGSDYSTVTITVQTPIIIEGRANG